MLKFSRQEIKDVLISDVVLALAFGGFGEGFIPALLIISVVFLTHELLGHKLVAQYLGCFAEYRKWTFGLALALIGSMSGFLFAAPGAVYIQPYVRKGFAWTIHRLTKKEIGLIAAAGPVVNVIFGFIFLFLTQYAGDYIYLVYQAAEFSFFLALFNMIPFGPLDGAKVSRWSWVAWGTIVALSGIGYFML